jgi:succinoglycan biosynthesis protein ExoW
MIAVIIPYFQREPGILRKALESVFASEGVNDLCVILVDDESPIPAKDELAKIGNTRFPVRLIQQRNAGPGGARNTGLDNLPDEVDYVAFLDSDDTWGPQHLRSAIFALEAGFDVYFCDHVQLGAEDSAFRRAGRIDPTSHRMIGGHPEIHAYEGEMFDQIITGNIIGTSTVVFDRRKFDGLRFRTDLTSAGEDYLFWLDLAHRGARFAFGAMPSVFYGKGVNVYAGAGWGTDGHARRIVHELTYRKALLSLYKLNRAQAELVEGAIRRLDEAFVADSLHRVAHRKVIDWKLVFAMLEMEPRIMFRFVEVIFGKVLRSIRR